MKLKSYLGIALLTVSAFGTTDMMAGGMPGGTPLCRPDIERILKNNMDELTVDEYKYLVSFVPDDAVDVYIGKIRNAVMYLKMMPPVPSHYTYKYFVLYSTGNGIYQAYMGHRGCMEKQTSVYHGLVEMRLNGKVRFINEETRASFIFANNSEDHKGSYVFGGTVHPVFVTHVMSRTERPVAPVHWK